MTGLRFLSLPAFECCFTRSHPLTTNESSVYVPSQRRSRQISEGTQAQDAAPPACPGIHQVEPTRGGEVRRRARRRQVMSQATEQDTPTPTACPFCYSTAITTASPKATASSYWRCAACGQMWNVGRLLPVHRQGSSGRWA